MTRLSLPFFLLASSLVVMGCDDDDEGSPDDAMGPLTPGSADGGAQGSLDASADASVPGETRDAAVLPYARVVTSFREGANAGFGSGDYPRVVLGPPKGEGTNAGSLDVLSLGVGGEIVLDFGERTIVDGPGPDFIVFENPFWPGGVATSVFAELGEVSVSTDLTSWQTFPCSTVAVTPGTYPGCAGWSPTLEFDPFAVVPLDPAQTGGDAFDLATVSATSARYVRIRDLSLSGIGDSAGFDLDAIGIIHASP